MNDLFSKGYKRPLENSDVYEILPQEETRGLVDRLDRCIKQLFIYNYNPFTSLSKKNVIKNFELNLELPLI